MSLILFAGLLLPSLSSSRSVYVPRQEVGAFIRGVVSLSISPVNKAELAVTNATDLKKREGAGILPVGNGELGTAYMVAIQIGTPPQYQYLQLDTGSSDTWVNPTCSGAQDPTLCNSYPTWNVGKSTTWQDTQDPIDIVYGSGSVQGEYLTDDFILGAYTTISQQQFGYAFQSTILNSGLLGMGIGKLLTGYNTVIDSLAAQGQINSPVFSLDLGSIDSSEGSIIFGGIDTMKYSGKLEKRQIIPYVEAPDQVPRYWIYMTSVGNTPPGSHTSSLYTAPGYQQAVFLDSGATFSQLPEEIVNEIVSAFPGAYLVGTSSPQYYVVDCKYASADGTIDFGFGGTVINVPYHQFIWQSGGFCFLGVVATVPSDVTWILGDTFLRSAFVVYDQGNSNILIANAASCGQHLVAIGSGVDAVPSITGQCSSSSKAVWSSASSSSTKSKTHSATITGVTWTSMSTTESHSSSGAKSPSSTPVPTSHHSSTSAMASTSIPKSTSKSASQSSSKSSSGSSSSSRWATTTMSFKSTQSKDATTSTFKSTSHSSSSPSSTKPSPTSTTKPWSDSTSKPSSTRLSSTSKSSSTSVSSKPTTIRPQQFYITYTFSTSHSSPSSSPTSTHQTTSTIHLTTTSSKTPTRTSTSATSSAGFNPPVWVLSHAEAKNPNIGNPGVQEDQIFSSADLSPKPEVTNSLPINDSIAKRSKSPRKLASSPQYHA